MFSRLAIRTGLQALQAQRGSAASLVGAVRLASDTPAPSNPFNGPERDLVNFPRPTRLEHASPTRYLFVPEEWFEFFYKKTGVTGPYVFGGGVITYMLSKEIWVIEHDFGFVIAFGLITWYINRQFGEAITKATDKMVDEDEKELTDSEHQAKQELKDAIADEKDAQWRADGNLMLFDAKRENVGLQLESIYRERALQVYTEVKKRLDFQLEIENVERRIAQKHMVQWIIKSVLASISGAQEKETLQKCIVDLKGLAARA